MFRASGHALSFAFDFVPEEELCVGAILVGTQFGLRQHQRAAVALPLRSLSPPEFQWSRIIYARITIARRPPVVCVCSVLVR